MLLLVAMTTPMLLLATALPSFSSRIRGPLRSALARTAAFLPGMAGLWLVLAGAAIVIGIGFVLVKAEPVEAFLQLLADRRFEGQRAA